MILQRQHEQELLAFKAVDNKTFADWIPGLKHCKWKTLPKTLRNHFCRWWFRSRVKNLDSAPVMYQNIISYPFLANWLTLIHTLATTIKDTYVCSFLGLHLLRLCTFYHLHSKYARILKYEDKHFKFTISFWRNLESRIDFQAKIS